MSGKKKFTRILLTSVTLTALLTALVVYALMRSGNSEIPGSVIAAQVDLSDTTNTKPKIIYWRAPMDPMEIYDEPGKSKMGMDLVPVYEDEAEAGGDEDGLVGGVDIKIDPVVQQNMGLKTARVQKGGLSHTIRTYGHITYDDTRTFAVSAKAGGWVEKLHADYTGYFVEKGAPLYQIYSPSLVAAQEEYLTAFKNFTRHKTPFNDELLTSAKKRLSFFDIGNQEIKEIETTGRVRRQMTIRSPYTGVVIQKKILEGAYVKPGASLFTISDLSRVWVEAHIFEYEQTRVRLGQTVEMILSFEPDRIYSGEITYIFPYLQPKTRDVVIRIEFDNPDLVLKPDMFARIHIETGQGSEGLSIPAEAVIHSGDSKIVFVQKNGGKFSPRQVTIGMALDGGNTQVITGLSQDETVVVSGQFLLDSESKLKEAIQKMMDSQKKVPKNEAKSKTGSDASRDGFFDDMDETDGLEKTNTADDDFFKDMG